MCSEAAEHSATDTGSCAKADARDEGAAAGDRQAEIIELRFNLLRSALYHDDREQALAWRNRAAAFATIVLGSGVVVALLSQYPLGGIAAALVTVLINAGTLVYDFSGGARDHRDLKRRFYELLAEVEGPEPDAKAIHRRMILAFADEPPMHRALNALAHNQAGDLIWGPGNFSRVRVSLLSRVTRHLLTWRSTAFAPDRPAED